MAEKIKILLTAQDKTKSAFKSVDTKMNKLKRSSKMMAAALGPIGGFAAAGALVAIGKQAIGAADDIQKMSQRLGISTEALSQYRHVADLSGTSFEVLAKGVAKSQRAVADAERGLSTAIYAFEDMGLELATIQKMKPEDAFEAMGEAVAAIEDPFKRASAAAAVFGRAGKEMLPIFNKGAGAVREMRAEADRLGITLSQDVADDAAEAADAMQRIDTAMKGLQLTIASVISEPLAEFLNNIVLTATKQTPFQQMTAGMQRLKEEMPSAYNRIREMQQGTKDFTVEMTLAAIAAEDLAAAISKPEFDGDLLGMSKKQANTDAIAAARAEADAFNASLKDYTSGITEAEYKTAEMNATMANAEGWVILREEVELLGPAAEEASNSLYDLGGAAEDAGSVLSDTGQDAAQMFGDSIVDAALRGEAALISMGDVAKQIFGMIMKMFIKMGISYITGGVTPYPDNFIGPIKSYSGDGLKSVPDGSDKDTSGADSLKDMSGGLVDDFIKPLQETATGLASMSGSLVEDYIGSVQKSAASVLNSVIGNGLARDYISPMQTPAMSGPMTISGGVNITATSTISNDPMSTRRLAEQIHDELKRVGETRGFGGAL